MRADEIIENNQRIGSKVLKTELDVAKATLSVLTDISETLAMMTDLTASIYGREILNKKQLEQIRQQQMARQMPQVMQNVEQ